MNQPLLLLVTSAHLVVWIALLALAGQFVLGFLAGAGRERNPVYRLLGVVASPFVGLIRKLAPGAVHDRHIPLATFLVLGVALVLLTIARIRLCLHDGLNLCA